MDGSFLGPVPLKIGVTRADFQSLGTIPVEIERLKMYTRIGQITCTPAFRRQLSKLSASIVHLLGNLNIKLYTSLGSILEKENLADDLSISRFGRELFKCLVSSVPTEVKKELNWFCSNQETSPFQYSVLMETENVATSTFLYYYGHFSQCYY